MSSLETEIRVQRSSAGGVFRLLDAMLGLILWAGHFLIVYIGAAMTCVLQLGAENADAGTALRVVLTLVTVGVAGLVALHGFRRYRQQRHDLDQRFRMSVTIGCDAIAIVAILGQLLPIWLVPVCA
jgi:hypothetical protein